MVVIDGIFIHINLGSYQRRPFYIGYIDYGGFIDLDENGEYTGYGVELLDKIAEYTGWKYEYVYDTWDNVLKKLESGEIDMICQAQYMTV